VCDEGTRWGEQLIAEAERRAQERVALPPLGELRSGLGQRGAVAAPGKPSHLPAIAGPVIDALHAQWNQRSMEAMARLFAAEGRWRGPGDQDGGARQASAWAARLIDAFADGAWMMERGEAEGDLVAVLWRFHGHHVRPYLGEAPTGRRVKLIGSTVVQLDAAGRITDEDTVLDELALQVQLRTPVTWL
jgi:predicted ester cyclase